MGFIFHKKDPSKPWVERGSKLEVVKVKKSPGERHEHRASFHFPFMTEEMKKKKDDEERQRQMDSMGGMGMFGRRGRGMGMMMFGGY